MDKRSKSPLRLDARAQGTLRRFVADWIWPRWREIALAFAFTSCLAATTGGYPLRVSYVGGDGNDMTLTVVPEPLSIAYAAAAAQLGVRLLRRRRPSRNRRSTKHPTHHPI